jgi:hypothetical protein
MEAIFSAQLQSFFRLELRLVALRGEHGLYPFLDGEIDLALSIIEFALLADQLGLGLLRFGKLVLARLQDKLKVGQFFVLLIKIGGGEALGLFGFLGSDALAFSPDLVGHLPI